MIGVINFPVIKVVMIVTYCAIVEAVDVFDGDGDDDGVGDILETLMASSISMMMVQKIMLLFAFG